MLSIYSAGKRGLLVFTWFLVCAITIGRSSSSYGDEQVDSAAPASIALVGVDGDKKSVVKNVALDGFQQSLGAALSAVQDSILPSLDQKTNFGGTCSAEYPQPLQWSMRTVGVGVGMSAQVGAGPIWNITVTPHIRLIYTNSTNPVYPD
jgi:hypothetical protein